MEQQDIKNQILPALAMLIKLIKRKENGTRKFSDSFNYKKVIEFLENVYEDITTSTSSNMDLEIISQLAVVAYIAMLEIKNQTLINDYTWIMNTFKLLEQSLQKKKINLNYYLAYGSNLKKEQMITRCPSSVLIGHGILDNYALIYRESKSGFFLTIEPVSNRIVPFAIYQITNSDRYKMDEREGQIYYKKPFDVEIIDLNGNKKNLNTFAYVLPTFRRAHPPKDDYIERVTIGYKNHGFDLSILDKALDDTNKIMK